MSPWKVRSPQERRTGEGRGDHCFCFIVAYLADLTIGRPLKRPFGRS
jgi:hypothetical protein